MRIGLIAMSGVRIRSEKLRDVALTLPAFRLRAETIARLPSLGLLTVAALTPSGHHVEYLEIDELSQAGDLPEFDLVAISALTARIFEAYRLADIYRERGTTVVMGGLHVSILPDEALGHADAVVVDAAEGAWPRLLADFERGELRSIYRGLRAGFFEDDHYVMPAFEYLEGRPYNRVTVQTSRGCPRNCEFCGASLMISDGYNQKPVDRVVAEIEAARRVVERPFFELADDNTFLNRRWARALLRKLAPLGIQYFAETDASVADDPGLCDLLAASGCRQVLIGFESPRREDLEGLDPVGWKRKQAPRIRQVVDTLQSRGIRVNGCFVLGLDQHTPDVFEELFDFVAKSGMADVQYTVLTPFPGTPLYARLEREGRLLGERRWDRCTLFDVNFVPAQMTVEQLEQGLRWLFEETYSRAGIDTAIEPDWIDEPPSS